MTIAWQLFYLRTSRDIRGSTPRQQQQQQQNQVEEDQEAVLDFRRRNRDRDRGTAVRRPSRSCLQQGKGSPLTPPRHPLRRATAQLEREPVVSEKRRTSEDGARNSSKYGVANSCVGSRTFIGRLPGPVMEARARLTERLRNCHLSESRPKDAATGVSPDTHESVELAIGDCGYQHTGKSPGLQEETFVVAGAINGMKAPVECSICLERFLEEEGLVWRHCGHKFHLAGERSAEDQHTGAASVLQEETFVDEGEIAGAQKAPAECSICLESFLEGEELVRLHCGHRFHHACLEPWFRAHLACPYCRANA